MSKYIKGLIIIDKIVPGGLEPSTGGSTLCRHC